MEGMDQREIPELLDSGENPVLLVTMECLAQRVHEDKPVREAVLDHLDHLVHVEMMELLALLVSRVLPVLLVMPDSLVVQVLRVKLGLLDPVVLMDLQGVEVNKGHKVLLVQMALLVLLVEMEIQVAKEK